MSGICIQPLVHADIPQLPRFQPPDWVADITSAIAANIDLPDCYPVKALLGLMGTVPNNSSSISMVGIGNLGSFGRSAWFSQIIVLPEYQGQGIGNAIMRHLIDLGRNIGVRSFSLIATDQGRRIYTTLGFTDQMEYVFLKTPASVHPAARDYPAVSLRPAVSADWSAIHTLDARMSGENRDWLLDLHREGAMVVAAPGGNGLAGFYLPALREGLCVATSTNAGRTLLAEKARRSNRLVLPAANTAAIEAALDFGYALDHRSWRMSLGQSLDWQPEMLWGRIAGAWG